MIVVAQVFALVCALVHLLAFAWESFLFHRPAIHRDLFKVPASDLPAVRLWTFNVGFYNLFLGLGPIAGVVALQLGHETVGRTLIIYTAIFMVGAGIALAVSDRLAMSRPRGSGIVGSLFQTVPALITLAAITATS